jgi:hypothetical protein
LLLCGGLYAKNLAQRGEATAGTCSGINLWRVSTAQLDPAERDRLIAQGELSRYAAIDPNFLHLTAPEILRDRSRTGVRLLDEPVKSTNLPNFNAEAYAEPCERYAEDARTVMRKRPRRYASGVANGTLISLRPVSDYAYLEENRVEIAGLERAYAAVAFGQFDRTRIAIRGPVSENARGIGWFVLAAYTAAFAWALLTLVRARRSGSTAAPETLFAAFLLVNMVWIGMAGNLLESGENNRFRLALDPLVLAATAAGLAARGSLPRPRMRSRPRA